MNDARLPYQAGTCKFLHGYMQANVVFCGDTNDLIDLHWRLDVVTWKPTLHDTANHERTTPWCICTELGCLAATLLDINRTLLGREGQHAFGHPKAFSSTQVCACFTSNMAPSSTLKLLLQGVGKQCASCADVRLAGSSILPLLLARVMHQNRALPSYGAHASYETQSVSQQTQFPGTEERGTVLPRFLDTFSDQYEPSTAKMSNLLRQMQREVHAILAAGGEKAVARHRARGKMLPRERIHRLLDEGSPFLELSPLAGKGLYGGLYSRPSPLFKQKN